MTHPAHVELQKLLLGLSEHPLPPAILSTMHAGRRVAHAAQPLDTVLDAALQRATTWKDLLAVVQQWESINAYES